MPLNYPVNLDVPYPSIQVEAKNPGYARTMLSNIGEQNSEATAYALYLYDHTITASDPEISGAFRTVMEAERKHMELFCNAAFQLGADPRLWMVTGVAQQPMRYWNPGQISYTANTKALLQNALALERATIAKYERQVQEIKDDSIGLLLRRILLDESLHVEIFRDLLQRLEARQGGQDAGTAALPAVAVAPSLTAQQAAVPVSAAPMMQTAQTLWNAQQGLPPQAQMMV